MVNYTGKGNASLGLNHTSIPLDVQNVSGKNGGKEGCNLATPTDLSMVPSLGTWAEKQRMQVQSSETNHLNNPITTPERTRPTEIEKENGTTTPTESETTEHNHKQLESEQESENPIWSETDSSTEMFDLDEINIEEHEETRKQLQSKLGMKRGIMLASWNTR